MQANEVKESLFTPNDKKILHGLISRYRVEVLDMYIAKVINKHTYDKLIQSISWIQDDLQRAINESNSGK